MSDNGSVRGARRGNIFTRLYRGDTDFDIVGRRRTWYVISAVLLVVIIGSMVFKGFNLGVEFAGGSQFTVAAGTGTSLADAQSAVEGAGAEVASAQTVGSGAQVKYVIKTEPLKGTESQDARAALAKAVNAPDINAVTVSEVSSSWGKSVSRQAVIALGIFLVFVFGYMWLRFELKMAFAGLFALIHDVLLTAGVFSIVGFEVTPGTVVGMLTILGYSLYDTVVVFDRVQEDTKGILNEFKLTYGEAANKALNETLMRSINTSLIGLLPVAGLLFVGVGLLGVGTLKDLALVLFVGMLTGTYSSIFLATPALVDLRMMEPRVRDHQRKVLEKRKAAERKAAEAAPVAREAAEAAGLDEDDAGEEPGDESGDDGVYAGSGSRGGARAAGPRPGARPDGRKRRTRKS